MSQLNRRRKSSANKARRIRTGLRWLSHTGIMVLLLASVAGGGWWLNQALSVHSWKIGGVHEKLEIAIEKEIKALPSLDMLHAWPSRLRAHLLAQLPDLAEVNISRHLPDRLEIQATPRMPVAMWRSQSGDVMLVDGHGVAYRPLQAGEMLDLPLLRAGDTELQESVALLLALKQKNRQRYARLSEMIVQSTSWRLNFERGRTWLLPRGELAMPRMNGVLALLQDKRWAGGDWSIDVRFGKRWFIRKSKLGGMV